MSLCALSVQYHLQDLVNVQCDDGAHQEVVPDVFPVVQDHINDQLVCNEYELRKGGTVPEDGRVSTDRERWMRHTTTT